MLHMHIKWLQPRTKRTAHFQWLDTWYKNRPFARPNMSGSSLALPIQWSEQLPANKHLLQISHNDFVEKLRQIALIIMVRVKMCKFLFLYILRQLCNGHTILFSWLEAHKKRYIRPSIIQPSNFYFDSDFLLFFCRIFCSAISSLWLRYTFCTKFPIIFQFTCLFLTITAAARHCEGPLTD